MGFGGHVRPKVAPGPQETGSNTWFTWTCVLSDLTLFGKADCAGTLNNASIKDGNTCFERDFMNIPVYKKPILRTQIYKKTNKKL